MPTSPRGWATDVLNCASARTRTLVTLVILAGLAFLTFRSSSDADFVLVIDSGSTGTRIHAYRWQQQPGQVPLLTALGPRAAQQKVPRKAAGDVRAYERVETEPGLDKFVDDPSGLWTTALQPLLAWAEAVVPRSQWSATPVFLFGTAGLRVLNPDSQTKLLGSVQRSLAASVFRFEPEWARVISGKDEGIYGWIALNYLTGHLAANAGQAGRGGGEVGETVGAVDLGGSSLEVSFVPEEPLPSSSESQVKITVLGTDYSLYAHVHHSYGLNDAFDRSVAHLLSTQQLDSNTESALRDSVQQKPLDQDDTSVLTEAAAEAAAAEGRQLTEDELLSASTAALPVAGDESSLARSAALSAAEDESSLASTAALSAAEVGRPAQHESSSEVAAASREVAQGRQLQRHESSPADTAADKETDRSRELGVHESSPAAPVTEGLSHHRRHLLASPRDSSKREAVTAMQHDKARDPIQLPSGSSGTHSTAGTQNASSSQLTAGAPRRSMLQEGVQVSHPCLHEGYSKKYAWVAHGAHVTPLPKVQLLGRPDWEGCKALAAAVVNASQPCPSSSEHNCALGVSQPATSQRMYALTGFFVVLKFLHLPSDASLAEVEAAGQAFCDMPWKAVNLSRGKEIHVDRYCFRVPYIMQLLAEGLGLPEGQVTVGSGREGWTLGAALAEGSKALTNRSSRSSRSSLVPGSSYTHQPILWALAGAFAALSLALFLYFFCFQASPGGSTEGRPSHNKESNSPWHHSSEAAQTQDRLVLRVPSPSPFSSMEPVTALRAANLSGKFSPPPFRQGGTSRQNGQPSMPRMASLASGGHRKRQLSFSSLSLDTLDADHE